MGEAPKFDLGGNIPKPNTPKFNLGGNDIKKEQEQVSEIKDSENSEKLKSLLGEKDISKINLKLLIKLINSKFENNEDLKKILNDEKLSSKLKEEIIYDLANSTNPEDINEKRLNTLIRDVLTQIKEEKTEAKIEEKTEVKEEKTEVKEEKTEVKEEKTEVKEKKTEVKEEKTEVKEEKTTKVETEKTKVENETEKKESFKSTKEIREKALAEFNELSQELASKLDLNNPKYKGLRDKAEQELLSKNPGIKNTTDPKQYESYINGIVLLSNKQTFINDNPKLKDYLESNFAKLEKDIEHIPPLCHIPSLKETRINNFIENDKTITRKNSEKLKKIVMDENLKDLNIDKDIDGSAKLTLTDKEGQKEIIELDKNGDITTKIENKGISIDTTLENNIDVKLKNDENGLIKDRQNKIDSLKTKELKEINFDNEKEVNFGVNILNEKKSKLTDKNLDILEEKTKLNNQLKEIKLNKTYENYELEGEIEGKLKDIESEEMQIKKEMQNIENDIKIMQEIKELNFKLKQIGVLLDQEEKENDKERKRLNEKLKSNSKFLEDSGIALLIEKGIITWEKFTQILKNSEIDMIQRIDTNKADFNLGPNYRKIFMKVVNCMFSGDKTKPIDTQKYGDKINEIFDFDKVNIKKFILNNPDIDSYKLQINLEKFNLNTNQKPSSGEETK